MLKQAIDKSEFIKIKALLAKNGLTMEPNLTETLYIEENDEVIATISREQNILKCLAVDERYQNENYASRLVTEMINSLANQHIYNYRVFTPTKNIRLFESMNFRLLASTANVAILEGGHPSIEDEIEKMKVQIKYKLGIANPKNYNIGCMVVNCNPITLGHLQLIESSAKKHHYFIVFVVEEDYSLFSFPERFSMVFLAVAHLGNVIVLPSSKYMVSALTFPTYFLKTKEERNREYTLLDALLFKNYFMKELNISHRYLGTETDPVMIEYNNALKEVLQDQVTISPRFEKNGKPISATTVRKLILENKIEEALELVPRSIASILKPLARQKYEINQ